MLSNYYVCLTLTKDCFKQYWTWAFVDITVGHSHEAPGNTFLKVYALIFPMKLMETILRYFYRPQIQYIK